MKEPALLNNTSSVFLEAVLYALELTVHLLGNFRIYNGTVVVFLIVIGKNVEPVLTVLIPEGRVIILKLVEVFESNTFVVEQYKLYRIG